MKDEFKINGFSAVSEKEMLNVDGGFDILFTAGIIALSITATAMILEFGKDSGWWL